MALRQPLLAETLPYVSEPPDPWGPDGSAAQDSDSWPGTLSDADSSYPPALARPAAAPESPKPPLVVELANGYTAFVEHPDSPDYQLGGGGQGQVYRARVFCEGRDTPLAGEYALKRSRRPTHEETPALDEVESGAALIHQPDAHMVHEAAVMDFIYRASAFRNGRPGVPRMLTYGRDRDWQYTLQEIAHGEGLSEHIKAGRELPVLQIMSDLLATVAAMEEGTLPPNSFDARIARYGGIVHNDLKPGNVLHDPTTGETRIIDGGIAHGRLQEDYKPDSYEGTDIWMAPEQWAYNKQCPGTNQYQLALIWLELRTNGGYSKLRHDMNRNGEFVTFGYQTHSDLHWDGINQLMTDHDIPYEEQRIMLRALQNDPKRRWPSTQAMLDALADYRWAVAIENTRRTAYQAAYLARVALSEQPTQALPYVP